MRHTIHYNATSSHFPLRDTTNSLVPRDQQYCGATLRCGSGAPAALTKPYCNTRHASSNDAGAAVTPTTTPKTASRRPLTPQTGGSTQPHRHASLAAVAATTASTSGNAGSSRFANLTPQKPLFQRSLLREIAAHEEPPLLTVVLDLDETLVSNRRADLPKATLRPYVLDTLAALRALPGVEIVMWTASTEETGSQVVKQLHAGGAVFDEIIFRNDDWFTEPVHTKDLRLLGRDMDRVVVVDNAPNCCKLNKGNALLIEDFMGTVNAGDHSLVNMLYAIKSLIEGVKANKSVPQSLELMSTQGDTCYSVNYPVPEAWAHVKPRDVAPIMYPPHGSFYKLHSTVTQRHPFRIG